MAACGLGGGTSSETLELPLQEPWLAQHLWAPTVLKCEATNQLAQEVHDALELTSSSECATW